MMSSGGGLEPDTDIIQILSLKTNNQMQSYSPPALSLSYQSSLPEKTSSVFTYIYTTTQHTQLQIKRREFFRHFHHPDL